MKGNCKKEVSSSKFTNLPTLSPSVSILAHSANCSQAESVVNKLYYCLTQGFEKMQNSTQGMIF